jgi:hypothetical protein
MPEPHVELVPDRRWRRRCCLAMCQAEVDQWVPVRTIDTSVAQEQRLLPFCEQHLPQFDGGGAGSQDPSDEAQQRPLRGSMPSPATAHIDGRDA